MIGTASETMDQGVILLVQGVEYSSHRYHKLEERQFGELHQFLKKYQRNQLRKRQCLAELMEGSAQGIGPRNRIIGNHLFQILELEKGKRFNCDYSLRCDTVNFCSVSFLPDLKSFVSIPFLTLQFLFPEFVVGDFLKRWKENVKTSRLRPIHRLRHPLR